MKSKGRSEDKRASSGQENKSQSEEKKVKIESYVRDQFFENKQEAEKVKLLALLKAMREEMNTPYIKGMKVREFADIFVERYNSFYRRTSQLFPESDFCVTFSEFEKGATSLEKIRLEITLLIAYIQNDIMDIIEESQRVKEKNKWLSERLREMELRVAGIQAIK
jgi:hypothetical protein